MFPNIKLWCIITLILQYMYTSSCLLDRVSLVVFCSRGISSTYYNGALDYKLNTTYILQCQVLANCCLINYCGLSGYNLVDPGQDSGSFILFPALQYGINRKQQTRHGNSPLNIHSPSNSHNSSVALENHNHEWQ